MDLSKGSQSSQETTSRSHMTADFQQFILNGRPLGGFRRQATMYPHGLGVSVHEQNYSKASTCRSSWDCGLNLHSYVNNSESSQQKYKIKALENTESLAELQVRRYKYALNPYLEVPETPKPYNVWWEYISRFRRWKYLKWPILFTSSVLIFFGFITYCIWLHDISVSRQKYMLRRNNYFTDSNEFKDEYNIATEDNLRIYTTTERLHGLHESTILRAINNKKRIKGPNEQKLTTVEYDTSKGNVEWIKDVRLDNKGKTCLIQSH